MGAPISGPDAGSSDSYPAFPLPLLTPLHLHTRPLYACTPGCPQSEYVKLACAAGEWAAAVKQLVALGGREHIQHATQLTVEAVESPQVKGVRGE